MVSAGLLLVSAPANAERRPVNEGGDARPCVTLEEFNAAALGAPRDRIARIFDTRGHRVHGGTLDAYVAAVGGPEGPRQRQVRAYPICAEELADGGGKSVFVEFNLHRRRAPATAMVYP